MSDNEFSLSRRKALAGLGSIGAASALGIGGTWAQFSDTEEKAVTFTAGGIDGKLEWSGSYNGNEVGSDLTHVNINPSENGAAVDVAFTDIKPGDFGCVNFDITIQNNPAWVASCLDVVSDDDWKTYEPEVDADDDIDEMSDGMLENGNGELAENIYTIPYYDGDGSCTFFDPDGLTDFDSLTYEGANPSDFWSNAQAYDPPEWIGQGNPDPISVSTEDETEYYLVPRSLQDVDQNVRSVDTAHWSSGQDATLDVQTAPDGATVGAGCVMLDGKGSENDSNNTQGVAPLDDEDTLNFGYDFHMPFGVGNEAQGDKLELSLEFVFLQTRHTSSPDFDTYDAGQNIPNNSTDT